MLWDKVRMKIDPYAIMFLHYLSVLSEHDDTRILIPCLETLIVSTLSPDEFARCLLHFFFTFSTHFGQSPKCVEKVKKSKSDKGAIKRI